MSIQAVVETVPLCSVISATERFVRGTLNQQVIGSDVGRHASPSEADGRPERSGAGLLHHLQRGSVARRR